MLIPLGTDRPLHSRTVVTWVLIGVNVALFLVERLLRAGGDPAALDWTRHLTLFPDADPWWTLFGYSFRHAGWMHLIGNMLFLWVFGPNIEDRFTKLGFLAFYLLGAGCAGGLHIAFSDNPVVGASGAIAACTGAYMIMFPLTMVRVLSLLFVIGLIRVPAWWFVGLSVVWDLLSQGSGRATRTAHAAHLGGYAFGMLVSFTLLWVKALPREPYDVFSMVRQRYRRQQIRSAATGQQKRMAQKWERARAAPAERNGKSAAEAARTEALAEARGEVSALLAKGDLAAAATAYKRLAEQHPAAGGATVLSRRYQYELANHYFATGDHDAAVYAYERFLEGYPRDPEAPQVKLLLGRVNARYLNDPVRAKALLEEALRGLRDDDARAMAKRELEALG